MVLDLDFPEIAQRYRSCSGSGRVCFDRSMLIYRAGSLNFVVFQVDARFKGARETVGSSACAFKQAVAVDLRDICLLNCQIDQASDCPAGGDGKEQLIILSPNQNKGIPDRQAPGFYGACGNQRIRQNGHARKHVRHIRHIWVEYAFG